MPSRRRRAAARDDANEEEDVDDDELSVELETKLCDIEFCLRTKKGAFRLARLGE